MNSTSTAVTTTKNKVTKHKTSKHKLLNEKLKKIMENNSIHIGIVKLVRI